jgi:hypothetical protein
MWITYYRTKRLHYASTALGALAEDDYSVLSTLYNCTGFEVLTTVVM